MTGTIYESNPIEKARMQALKAEIRKVLPTENIREYDVEYKDGALIGVDKFIDLAKEDIIRTVIDTQTSEDDLTENQREILYHQTQADEKSVTSNARKAIEDDIVKNIDKHNVITVRGESGNGKSTLMAKLSKRIAREYESMILFSSLTPRTTSASGVLRIVTEYITEALIKQNPSKSIFLDEALEEYNIDQEELAREDREYVGRSREEKLYEAAIREYTSVGKNDLVILIDAIDQLDNPRGIDYLLKPLHFTDHSKVKFIISYLDTTKNEDEFLFLNDYTSYKLLELTYDDRLEVINASLAANNKELAEEIKHEIVSKEGSKSPLYISLLVQRLIMMNSEDYNRIIKAGDGYETIINYQKNLIHTMPNDLEELIIELIGQAARNLFADQDAVFQTVGYLSISSRGLREEDLRLIFELKGKNYNSLDFASLRKYLRAFFLEDKYLRTDFTHKIIRRAILDTMPEDLKIAFHNDIAEALMLLPVEDPIKLQEQYYSAYRAKNVDAALELMLNIGENSERIGRYEVESAVQSITKNHNVKLDKSDDKWMAALFEGFSAMDFETQKVLLTYFVYGSYEEKTDESIKAANYNQELLLNYIRSLIDIYQDDQQLMQIYSDHTSYLGVKYTRGSRDQRYRAETILSEALSINQFLYGIYPTRANKEKLAASYSNLARFFLDSGDDKRKQAKDLYHQSLDLFEELAVDDDRQVNYENLALAYNSVAQVYASGEYRDTQIAKNYYTKSLEILDNLLEDNPSISLKKTIAMSYINIASLYFSEDNYNKAQKWYNRAIDMIKQIEALEPTLDNKETLARVYNNTADLYASDIINNRVLAEKYYKASIEILETIIDHKPIISAKMSLSITYDNLGNLYSEWKSEDAYMYYKKAIDLKEELINMNSLKDDYAVLAASYNNLGFFFVDNNINLREAEANYLRALRILHRIEPNEIDKNYGEDLAVVYTNLGVLYFKLGDLIKSEENYRKAIGIHKTLIEEFESDDNIEKLLTIYNNLAVNKIDMDFSLGEVEEEYIKVAKYIKIIQDPVIKLKKTAICYGNLGNMYIIKDNNFKLAEDCYLKSVDLFVKLIEKNTTVENIERLAIIYWNLAALYELWGKEDLAIHYKKEVDILAEEVEYEKNKDNINKFVQIHDLGTIFQ